MGIKTEYGEEFVNIVASEKPPHHMGIKTRQPARQSVGFQPLKNLPTTWGLRLSSSFGSPSATFSEKPPHHMGIKTHRHRRT